MIVEANQPSHFYEEISEKLRRQEKAFYPNAFT